jgi:hypothetical protein
MNISPLSFGQYKTEVVELRGGLNENVSSIELKPGELIECTNYMIAEGGYGGYVSTKGYEQVDGKVVPSRVISYIAELVEWTPGDIAINDTLTSDTTAEVFTVVGVHEDEWVLELTTPTDPITTASGDTFNTGAYELTFIRQQYGGNTEYHAALDLAYDLVTEVPGEGPVLGVYVFKGKIYAFRKTVGVATISCYVESPTTGWAEITQTVPLVHSSGHKFRFTEYTFFALSSSRKFYICDGKNKARECDGTSLTVITMGDPAVSTDTPVHIAAINDRLYLGYTGGILVGSTIGDPTDFTTAPILLTMGAEITNLTVGVGSTLVVGMEQGIKIVNGYDEDNIEVQTFSSDAGVIADTARRLLGTIFFLSDQGLTTMEAVTEFGDYAANSISQRFKRTLLAKKKDVSVALVSRELNQYRLFFNDGKALYISFEGREMQGATIVEFLIPVLTAALGETSDGLDIMVFTSDDGYVYKMDSGKSFNGSDITARMVTAYSHYKSPRNYKRFKRATFEIFGENGQEISVKTFFDYYEPSQPTVDWLEQQVDMQLGSAVWGSSLWGSMVWGGTSTVTSRIPYYINGVAINMAFVILSREKYRDQHIIQNIITDYQLCARRT